jgi:hypothetical protein
MTVAAMAIAAAVDQLHFLVKPDDLYQLLTLALRDQAK